MKSFGRITLFIALLGATYVANADYIVGGNGINVASSSGSWSWDGSQHAELRAALENPSNFGPGGTVNRTIDTVDLAVINAATLAGLDAFVSSWWLESQSAPFHADIINAFLGGMDLILLQDTSIRDGLASILGISTTNGSSNPQTPTAPLSNGPFGAVGQLNMVAEVGHLQAGDVLGNGGTICMTDAIGRTTAGCWAPGVFAPGAGSLIIVSDVDTISGLLGGADYATPNNKGRFGLNIFAFASTPVPEPGSLVLIGIGLVGMGLTRRRKIV